VKLCLGFSGMCSIFLQLVSWRVIYTDSYSLRMDLAKQQAKTTPINWNKDNVVVSLLKILY